ncbi:MAG: hypothetical protein IKD89_05615 [Clostridia bacterium]|nr:hypothetical protein [Clostridia bacterium]
MTGNNGKKRCARAGLILLLCAALMLAAGAGAFAADIPAQQSISADEVYGYAFSDETAALADADLTDGEQALVSMLVTAIWNGETHIEFNGSDYGVEYAKLSKLTRRLFMEPETFALKTVSWGYVGSVDNLYVDPVYYGDMYADYDAAKALYTDGVNAIAALVDDDMSDPEKALFVNDYLALNFEYDTTYTNYDAYSFFRDKKGVCQAYTRVYEAVMRLVGVETSYIESQSMNHSWNIVKIDGKWYHVDVTWNDPITTSVGCATHEYLLLSTDKMIAIGHVQEDDWMFGENAVCDDTTYDEFFWRESRSPFVYAEGSWYFINETGINMWDGVSGEPVVLQPFDDIYAELYPGYTFPGYCVNSGLFYYRGKLYFNSVFDVFEYDLTEDTVESLVSVLFDGTNLIGCVKDGNNLVYQESNGTLHYLDISPYTEVSGGGYGYMISGGELWLELNDGAFVVAAWYDDNGKMLGCTLIDTAGEHSVEMAGSSLKLISLNASLMPRCAAVTING